MLESKRVCRLPRSADSPPTMPATTPQGKSRPLPMGSPFVVLPIAISVVIGSSLAWHWQPHRQIEAHTQKFLRSIESQDWQAMQGLVADSYQDDWGMDQAELLATTRQLLTPMQGMRVDPVDIQVTLQTESSSFPTGKASTLIDLTRRGNSPLPWVSSTQQQVLATPFGFVWQQQSWRPDDWQLMKIENPALQSQDLEQWRSGGL
ncbi:MAG: hypothetical protein NW237_07700 [Cyanobacteriota bacterium]|nr:hypothetical protein [Cyanobacteriota bacterium]